MQKKIIILGSTGSIGKATLSIIKKNKKDFKIVLLSTNKNIKLISRQANLLKVLIWGNLLFMYHIEVLLIVFLIILI